MSPISLKGFKVVYKETVVRAVCIMEMDVTQKDENILKPKIIDILVVNSDGNLEILRDKAWMFQFIPALGG